MRKLSSEFFGDIMHHMRIKFVSECKKNAWSASFSAFETSVMVPEMLTLNEHNTAIVYQC